MEVLAILIASYFISEIATVLLTMTGVDRDTAKFQSISALTGTGFTTKEAAQVLNSPQQRQIIATLMILGRAGVILIFAGVIRQYQSHFFSLKIIGYVIAFYIFLKIFTRKVIANWIHDLVESYLIKYKKAKKPRYEELLHLADGYGVVEVNLNQHSTYFGKKIHELGLPGQNILILCIEREGAAITVPDANTILQENDVLVCYGEVANLKKI